MIQISSNRKINIHQKDYEEIIRQTSFNKIKCPKCNHKGGFVYHAYYYRIVHTESGKIRLRITRIKCKSCGGTHALLTDDMVPYSKVLCNVQIKMISANSIQSCEGILCLYELDSHMYYQIKKRYFKKWVHKIDILNLHFNVVKESFRLYSKMFMQIKNINNTLID